MLPVVGSTGPNVPVMVFTRSGCGRGIPVPVEVGGSDHDLRPAVGVGVDLEPQQRGSRHCTRRARSASFSGCSGAVPATASTTFSSCPENRYGDS